MKIDQIQRVAVVGAGDMGHGIAEVALLAGYRVKLYDIDQSAVERGAERIMSSVAKLTEKGKVPEELLRRIGGQLLQTTTDLPHAAHDADLILEAAPENLQLKKDVFRTLDQSAPASTVLASNTSTMSITQIAACTERASQVLGLHFFNPAVLMRLVEVIRAERTSDETIELGMALAAKFGKVPVLVRRDTPGFIANRVNQAPAVLIAEMIQRGEFQPEPLDAFMRTLGAPMGPCELSDYVGIDIVVNVSRYFAETLHEDYGPAPHLVQMMEDGKLGKKSGRGYFDWSEGRPSIDLSKATKQLNPLWPIFVQINEATKLVQQGVCSVADVDTALIHSTGNPLGPMSVGRQISRWDLSEQLQRLATKYNKSIFHPTQRVLDGGHKH